MDRPTLEVGGPGEEAVRREAVVAVRVRRRRVPRVEVGELAVLEGETVGKPEVESVADEQFAGLALSLAVLRRPALEDVRDFVPEGHLAVGRAGVVSRRLGGTPSFGRVALGDRVRVAPGGEHPHPFAESGRQRPGDGFRLLGRRPLDAYVHQ